MFVCLFLVSGPNNVLPKTRRKAQIARRTPGQEKRAQKRRMSYFSSFFISPEVVAKLDAARETQLYVLLSTFFQNLTNTAVPATFWKRSKEDLQGPRWRVLQRQAVEQVQRTFFCKLLAPPPRLLETQPPQLLRKPWLLRRRIRETLPQLLLVAAATRREKMPRERNLPLKTKVSSCFSPFVVKTMSFQHSKIFEHQARFGCWQQGNHMPSVVFWTFSFLFLGKVWTIDLVSSGAILNLRARKHPMKRESTSNVGEVVRETRTKRATTTSLSVMVVRQCFWTATNASIILWNGRKHQASHQQAAQRRSCVRLLLISRLLHRLQLHLQPQSQQRWRRRPQFLG